MIKPQRKKSTVFHVVYSRKARKNQAALQLIGNLSKQGLLPNLSSVRPLDEQKFRKIFDEEKPKSIYPTQRGAIFFWPEMMHMEAAAEIIKTKVGKQALVADAGIFSKVINYSERPGRFRPLIEGGEPEFYGWVREMARRYWATAIPLEMFEKYYRKYHGESWVRKKNAPVTMPRKIELPEILYPHKIRPQDIEKVPLKKTKPGVEKNEA